MALLSFDFHPTRKIVDIREHIVTSWFDLMNSSINAFRFHFEKTSQLIHDNWITSHCIFLILLNTVPIQIWIHNWLYDQLYIFMWTHTCMPQMEYIFMLTRLYLCNGHIHIISLTEHNKRTWYSAVLTYFTFHISWNTSHDRNTIAYTLFQKYWYFHQQFAFHLSSFSHFLRNTSYNLNGIQHYFGNSDIFISKLHFIPPGWKLSRNMGEFECVATCELRTVIIWLLEFDDLFIIDWFDFDFW